MEEGTRPTESPAQSHIIKRPRLTKLLDESGARVILLVAPAGYGKTTLARQWLAAFQRPVAWYRATTASADVAALATGLGVEVDTALADGETLTAGRMTSLAAVQQRPDVLARALSRSREVWPKRLVVAIDDYHQISGSAEAEAFVGELVSLLPATFLITTRTRPNWCTPRQAVYGEAVEVGTAELAMTEEEARQVFEASSRVALRASAYETARGWPVVIGLAARTGRTDFPNKALPRRLYEFLADDLVEAATPETQQALTALALCATNDLALARELLGPSADVALHEAEKRGLLTLEASLRLVLHPLLAELLIEKLREGGQTVIARTIDPLVGALMKSNRWDECLAVAEALPEACTFASAILENSLQELLSSGRVATIRRWVALAQRMHMTEPIIELADAEVALRAGEYGRALALGGHTARRSSSLDLRARAQLVAGRAANLSDQRAVALRWFRAAEASARSQAVRTEALWGQILVHHEEEENDEFEHSLKRLVDASDGTAQHESRLAHGRILLGITRGDIGLALEGADESTALLPPGSDPFARLAVLTQRAWLLGYAGRYDEAERAGARVITEAETQEIGFALNAGLLARARGLVGLRRFADARRDFDRVTTRLRVDRDPWASAELAVSEARLQISLGDFDRARDHLSLDPDRRVNANMRAEHNAYRALVEVARNRPEDASKWLELSRRSTQIEPRAMGWVVEDMLSVDRRSDNSSCLRGVERALESGYLDAIVIACRAHPDFARRIAGDADLRHALKALFLSSSDRQLARVAGLEMPRTSRHADAAVAPRTRGIRTHDPGPYEPRNWTEPLHHRIDHESARPAHP